ncbi:MAG: hypothetical protein GF335_00190 [Candidatus Moranbacteria bacterium]|nr:hypothetical protein [Candidatus Moranbacteria bacterium]
MKKVIVFIGTAFLLGCSVTELSKPPENKIKQSPQENLNQNREKPKRIGGQRDQHGCLTPAGYTWCEKKQKCLRTWEEPCE